mmetsp:Transcript_8119/g.16932  ORF Transcript_8119/g.16932 Transcript_8119/m.16932 type:complete len:216 (+) Transcript_8119:637-1284(+)
MIFCFHFQSRKDTMRDQMTGRIFFKRNMCWFTIFKRLENGGKLRHVVHKIVVIIMFVIVIVPPISFVARSLCRHGRSRSSTTLLRSSLFTLFLASSFRGITHGMTGLVCFNTGHNIHASIHNFSRPDTVQSIDQLKFQYWWWYQTVMGQFGNRILLTMLHHGILSMLLHGSSISGRLCWLSRAIVSLAVAALIVALFHIRFRKRCSRCIIFGMIA